MPQVKWTEYYKDKPSVNKTYQCFADVGRMFHAGKGYETVLPDNLDYYCKIDDDLTEDEVKFYVDALSKILDPTLFSCKKIDFPNKQVTFNQICQGLDWNVVLMYLTAQRYMDEYSGVVKLFYEFGKDIKDAENLFVMFQYVHWIFNNVRKHEYHFSGHGLIYQGYGFSGAVEPFNALNLPQFHERFKTKGQYTVNTIFKVPKNNLGKKYAFLKQIKQKYNQDTKYVKPVPIPEAPKKPDEYWYNINNWQVKQY